MKCAENETVFIPMNDIMLLAFFIWCEVTTSSKFDIMFVNENIQVRNQMRGRWREREIESEVKISCKRERC